MADEKMSLSGLTEAEAREFHGVFITSFMIFVAIALVAHVLAYAWRPWAPPASGYTSALEPVQSALQTLLG